MAREVRWGLGKPQAIDQAGATPSPNAVPMIGSILPNPDLIVRHTDTVKGRGVFAGRAFATGEVVETSPVSEIVAPWERLPRAVQLLVYDWGYLLRDPNEDRRGIALGVGSLFNHSDTPNVAFAADGEKQALVFTAVRDIAPGEELTIDYNADMPPGSPNWFDLVGITPQRG